MFKFVVSLILCFILWSYSLTYAASVTLAWKHSIADGVIGYNLYYGTNPNKLNVKRLKKITKYTLNNLTNGKKYYFEVKAYNEFGIESIPSNRVIYKIPVSQKTTTTIKQGSGSKPF